MPKTNRFHVKEIDKQNVTVEEERKYRSPFILFLIFLVLCKITYSTSGIPLVRCVYFPFSIINSSFLLKESK